jgi:hypothetical protein
MGLKTHELDALKEYLPDNTLEEVIQFMQSYKIHLILRKERKSILGDYRPPHQGKPHTISLNINLNKYHFLITFIHEVAHLINYLNHKRTVMPHGSEWKNVFALLLKRFTDKKVFPDDIHQAIIKSMSNLSASTCSDPALFRVLQKYDPHKEHHSLVESVGIGNTFKTSEGKLFKIMNKRPRLKMRNLKGKYILIKVIFLTIIVA